MIIREYGEFPMAFIPDIGEVIYARRSVARPWTKAAMVRKGSRGKDGKLRIQIQWLDDNPDAGTAKSPVVKWGIEWMAVPLERQRDLIRQIGHAAPPPADGEVSQGSE